MQSLRGGGVRPRAASRRARVERGRLHVRRGGRREDLPKLLVRRDPRKVRLLLKLARLHVRAEDRRVRYLEGAPHRHEPRRVRVGPPFAVEAPLHGRDHVEQLQVPLCLNGLELGGLFKGCEHRRWVGAGPRAANVPRPRWRGRAALRAALGEVARAGRVQRAGDAARLGRAALEAGAQLAAEVRTEPQPRARSLLGQAREHPTIVLGPGRTGARRQRPEARAHDLRALLSAWIPFTLSSSGDLRKRGRPPRVGHVAGIGQRQRQVRFVASALRPVQ
eukprot:scaffold1991_cov218-Pinguiococcus_pyrenoidosus.AAC.2